MKFICTVCALVVLTCIASAQGKQSSDDDKNGSNSPVPQIAHVTHSKSDPAYFVTDIGKPAFNLGDIVVFVNRTDYGPILTAKEHRRWGEWVRSRGHDHKYLDSQIRRCSVLRGIRGEPR